MTASDKLDLTQFEGHTEGEWEVDDDDEGNVCVLMGSALWSRARYQCHHRIVVCDDLPDGKQLNEALANAELLAASPVLLAKLREAVGLLQKASDGFLECSQSDIRFDCKKAYQEIDAFLDTIHTGDQTNERE